MHRHLSASLLLALSCLSVFARPAEDDGSERALLRRQQHELEAQHAQRLVECSKRFEVNKCRDKATAEHRASLKPLLERERSLDDEARANRALTQSLRSSARQSEEAASAPLVRDSARAASRAATHRPAARASEAQTARRAAQLQKDEEQAAERARLAQQRQAAIDAHARAVQQRNARREAKPGAGLPVPSAASIAALPSAAPSASGPRR